MPAHILAGPDPRAGAEDLAAHLARLGPLPHDVAGLIGTLERSELRGRGGASFPVGTKWRTVANRRRGAAVVLANGAEGEPLSHKDRLVMGCRPHLVLDGAFLAARSVGADAIVLYVGEDHGAARYGLERALGERTDQPCRVRVVVAPARYVAGEESAAVHNVNEGVALPTSVPPRPFEKGVDGRATLVQNVESLAHAALVARHGDAWFREAGRDTSSGTALVTLSGAVAATMVLEVAQGTTVGEAVRDAGGATAPVRAVLLGGYFGSWVGAAEAWTLPLDAMRLRATGRSLGCGVVALLDERICGVSMTAQIAGYLAGESAGQCGPCVFGLRAIAAALQRVAACKAEPHDLGRLRTWAVEARGRGACRHPDGAAGFVLSALDVFEEELAWHVYQGRCSSPSPAAKGAPWTP